MASIVAYIELREGGITPPSWCTVGEARRIAQAVGATVYAFLPVGPMSHVKIDALAEQISAAGADRIVCSSDETLAGPALDATHGPVLAQIAEHLRPLIFLFPAGGVGLQLGPPLAIRIGAAYAPAARIELSPARPDDDSPSRRVIVERCRAKGDGLRRIDVGDFERPVVVELTSAALPQRLGEPYAEVDMVPCPAAKPATIRLLETEVDEGAPFETCASLIYLPAATPESELNALRAALPANACVCRDDPAEPCRATPEAVLLLPGAELRRQVAAPTANTIANVSGTPADLAAALDRLRIATAEPHA